MGLIDIQKAERFSFRMAKEVAAYVKYGGEPEEALLGMAMAAASLMNDDERPDIRNKFLVREQGTPASGVSFSVLQRVLTKDDALNLAAHLAIAGGDVGPQVLRRMALIMETKDHEP